MDGEKESKKSVLSVCVHSDKDDDDDDDNNDDLVNNIAVLDRLFNQETQISASIYYL